MSGRAARRQRWVMAAAPGLVLLAGCAPETPLVDMTDVDPVVYQRVFDRCEAISQSVPDKIGPLVAGAVMGGTIGMGAGAVFGPETGAISIDEGIGAGAGAATGAGIAGVANAQSEKPQASPPGNAPAPPTPPRQQTVAECLTSHGYKVITPN